MFVIGNFVNALAVVLDYALTIYMWIVVARAVLSWVSPDPYNPIVRFLNGVTDPVFAIIRRKLPLPAMGIDISPIIVILVIIFLQRFLVQTLYQVAVSLR